MEKSSESFAQTLIAREMIELLKVNEQLKISKEDGSLPGEKIFWCTDKIEKTIDNLGHIYEFLGKLNSIENDFFPKNG